MSVTDICFIPVQMGNGYSSIPGLRQIDTAISSLQRSISDIGELPQNIIMYLTSIRDRLFLVLGSIQERFTTDIQSIVTRIDGILSDAETSLSQITDLLTEIGPVIRRVIDRSQSLWVVGIAGLLLILLLIAVSILVYKCIVIGTGRYGVDPLLVNGSLALSLLIMFCVVAFILYTQLSIA